MSDPAGSGIELHRRIHLTRLIGEGTMGRVFDGFAADTEQYVAVKVLRPEHADDPEIRARFENEIHLLGQIDHPGSPPVYGHGEDADGLPFCVMKKVEGRTLTELLTDRGGEVHSLPWLRRLLGILLDACETVAYAHEIGVVHRDLKPCNVLIDRHQSVYVIDWGIAKRAGGNPTRAGRVMGSPGYMAPEQADGRSNSVGPQADVFALGAILYEVLTGRRPFGGAGGREEMHAAVHRETPAPRRLNRRLPRGLARICMKALHKDPALRHANARALAADLRAFLEGRMSWRERAREFARHHPLRAVVVALLVLLAGTFAAGAAAQFWTDQRMAAKALKRLAVLDAELVKIAGEAESARSQLQEPGTGARDREALHQRLERLDARWIVTEFEALRLLASVTELRFVKVESEIHPLARERLLKMVKSLNERDQPALAGGLIDTVLARYSAGNNLLGLRQHEIAQLKQLAAEAEGRAPRPARK